MTITETDAVRNGVDTATLFATIGAVRAQPEAAQFQFRATNRWVSGTHSRGHVQGFFGAGQDTSREEAFVLNADHPTVLVGSDEGPTPVEYLLHALGGLPDGGHRQHRRGPEGGLAPRSSRPSRATSTSRGSWASDPEVRNGFQAVRIAFRGRGRRLRRGHRPDRRAVRGPAPRSSTSSPTGSRSRSASTPDPPPDPGGRGSAPRPPSSRPGLDRSPQVHLAISKTPGGGSRTMPS